MKFELEEIIPQYLLEADLEYEILDWVEDIGYTQFMVEPYKGEKYFIDLLNLFLI